MLCTRHLLPVFLTLALAMPNLAKAVNYADGIDGAELTQMLKTHFETLKIKADPHIAAARKFPACDHQPEISPRLGGKWATVKIKCTRPTAWSRAIRSQIDIPPPPKIKPKAAKAPVPKPRIRDTPPPKPTVKLIALRQSLPRGAVITADHITLIPSPDVAPNGAFTSPEAVIGRRIKLHLGQNRILQARHLEQNWLIEKNTPVAIAFEGRAVSILAPGIALENGQFGDMIRVQNRQSAQIIRGRIIAKGKIKVRTKIY